MSRTIPTSADAMGKILGIVASHVDVGTLHQIETTHAGQVAHRAGVDAARAARREHVPAAADASSISVEQYRPRDAVKRRGELVDIRASRMKAPRREHLDRYLDALRRRGHPDPAAPPFTGKMHAAGKLALDDWRAAVRALPPLVQLAIFEAFTTPARVMLERAAAAGFDLDDPHPNADLERPVWDVRCEADRKHIAFVSVVFAAAEPTTRPGFSHVCAGYGRGAIASVIANPYPHRKNRKLSKGGGPTTYGHEAMSCADADAYGVPRGAIPTARLMRACFGLPIEIHQPDAGAPGIGRHERSIDGRWTINQYWISEKFTRARWSKRARRNIASPDVLAWIGDKVTDADRREWESWLAELEREDREAPSLDEQLEHIARDFAAAESAAIEAHDRRDLRAALDASARAQRLRVLGSCLDPKRAAAARNAALERLGKLEASHALAADLSRRRRRGRRIIAPR